MIVTATLSTNETSIDLVNFETATDNINNNDDKRSAQSNLLQNV